MENEYVLLKWGMINVLWKNQIIKLTLNEYSNSLW